MDMIIFCKFRSNKLDTPRQEGEAVGSKVAKMVSRNASKSFLRGAVAAFAAGPSVGLISGGEDILITVFLMRQALGEENLD